MTLPGNEDISQLRPIGVSFNPETGFLVLSVDKISYGYKDHPVRYQGRVFAPKAELHITVISSQAAEMVQGFLAKKQDQLFAVEDLIDSTDWRFRKQPEMFHIEESPDVETIIQLVEVPALEVFFRGLSSILQQGVLLPPAHVTLYMRGTETGIGLPSQASFYEMSRARVKPGELEPIDNGENSPSASQRQA